MEGRGEEALRQAQGMAQSSEMRRGEDTAPYLGKTDTREEREKGSLTKYPGYGSAKATYASPLRVPILPPPQAMTTNWRPRIE